MKRCLIISLSFLLAISPLSACDCEAQLELDVQNWNEVPLIFTATLMDYKKTIQFGYFKFKVIQPYKGDLTEKEITIYFQPGKSHTLLHAVKDFTLQKEWIVFARKEAKEGKTHIRLKDNYTSKYCGLSRPVKEGQDPFIAYIERMSAYSHSFRQIVNENNITIAEGWYESKIPIGCWEYFDEKGKIILTGSYDNGDKVGEWLRFATDKYGEQIVIQKQYYSDGELTEKINYTYFGEIRSKTIFTDEQKTLLEYRNDQLISKQIKTLDNKLISRYRYKDGVMYKEEHFARDENAKGEAGVE
jgi:hypothetical protein